MSSNLKFIEPQKPGREFAQDPQTQQETQQRTVGTYIGYLLPGGKETVAGALLPNLPTIPKMKKRIP